MFCAAFGDPPAGTLEAAGWGAGGLVLGLVPEAVLEEVSREGSRAGAGPLRVAWEGR